MNKNSEELRIIPYTATSLSVIGRFIFMFLLYKNKSTNSLSLLFCILSIFSSGMWIYYSVQSSDTPMIVRSSLEISLLSISPVYIIYNKVRNYRESLRILPLWNIFRVIKKELIKLHLTSILYVVSHHHVLLSLSLFFNRLILILSIKFIFAYGLTRCI